MFNVIVAHDNKNGIGLNNKLPWYLQKDMNMFKDMTMNNVVIMGKNTWLSLPIKPLPKRINIVVSTTLEDDRAYGIFKSFEEAITYTNISTDCVGKHIFIIGGSKLYNTAINSSFCDKIYVTEIYKTYNCDRFFPAIPERFKPISVSRIYNENDTYFRYIAYSSTKWEWKNKEEHNYLTLLYHIILNGEDKVDRTGVGTKSVFSQSLTYDLTDTFPLLTTRKQFLRGIFEELMFYIRGQTDNNILVNKGVNIWNKNTSREFLDKRGLHHLPEGDMGSTYGFNFRHFGGEYKDCNTNYDGIGFDQLSNLIDTLKIDPHSRRLIISLWDPNNNQTAALPSCMCWYQFHVTNSNFLNLQIYIRSSDYFLANNWNTCTGGLLVHLLCNRTGLTHYKPGYIKVVMGDTHVYKNHIDKALEIKERIPKPFPKLIVNNQKNDITLFEWDDIELVGYKPDSSVKVKMAV